MLIKGEDPLLSLQTESVYHSCQVSLWENRVQEPNLESFSSWNGKQGRLWWPIPIAAVHSSYSQERKECPPFVKAASETCETGAERDREKILSETVGLQDLSFT